MPRRVGRPRKPGRPKRTVRRRSGRGLVSALKSVGRFIKKNNVVSKVLRNPLTQGLAASAGINPAYVGMAGNVAGAVGLGRVGGCRGRV